MSVPYRRLPSGRTKAEKGGEFNQVHYDRATGMVEREMKDVSTIGT